MLRSAVAFIFAALILLAGAPPEVQGQAAVEEKSFSAQPGDTLVVQNDYGQIQIVGWDSIAVSVRIQRNSSGRAGKEGTRVVAQKSGSKIFVYCFFSGTGGESVDLEMRVPKFLNVVIWGANPDLDLRGLQGFVHAQTFTGGISAEDLVSSVSLISDSGDISYRTIVQPAGDMRLETNSGNIRCDLAEKLNLRAWLRAGGAITWGKEPAERATSLEKQVGTFGPLLYAGSLKGNVAVTLKDAVVIPTPAPATGVPKQAQNETGSSSAEATARENPQRDTTPEKPRLSRPPGHKTSSPTVPEPASGLPAPEPPPPAPESESKTRDATPQPTMGPGGLTLKVNVDSVVLNVSVRDRQTNRSIPNLQAGDFQVYENGVPQQIEQLLPGEAPFNLLLLLDVSGSTRSFLPLMKQASIDFTREIKANDRVAIATFNSGVRLVQEFTNDRAQASRAIQSISSGGGTAFYDALLTCIDDYMSGIEGRSAIVVFTDGVDNQLEGNHSQGSRTPFPQLYRRIQEIEPIIYTIFLDTEGRVAPVTRGPGSGSIVIDILGGILNRGRLPQRYPGPSGSPGYNPAIYQEAREQLLTIAEQTGGRMYTPDRIEDLSRVYSEIADDLRIQYQLGYNSTNRAHDGRWREIRVTVSNRPDAVVRTRKGYYARKDPAQPLAVLP